MKIKLLTAIFLSLILIALIVFVYSPSLIYFAQVDEFKESFFELVFVNALIGFASSIFIVLLLSLCTNKWLKVFLSILFILAILSYLQVDYFAFSYGILDGSEIDFNQFDRRGNIELLVLGISLISAILLREWIAKNSAFVLIIMLVGLSGSLIFKAVSNPKELDESDSEDAEFNSYSSQKNVIIIILDGFGGEFFQKIIKQDPEIKKQYPGFVSYTDAISNYSATVGSIPSMLSGKMYPPNQQFKTFIQSEVGTNGLPKLFEKMDYLVSFISASLNFRNIYPKRFLSNVTQDINAGKKHNALKLLDFSVFRLSPHFIKPQVYAEGSWLFSRTSAKSTQIPNTFPEKGKYFLDYLTKHAVLGDEIPRFKVIHATIPHPDYKYNAQCEYHKYKKRQTSDYKMTEQSKCALLLLNRLLDQYKSMGVYENSVIVVTSDHGARVYDEPEVTGFPSDFELSASGILFMIKGVGQNQPFKQVDQPFSLIKLKQGLENEDKHNSDYSDFKDEKRLFYAYIPTHKSAKGYLSDAPIYEVSKNYQDPKSWQLKGFITNNCIKRKVPLKMTFSRSNRAGYCGAFGFKQYGKNFEGIWTSGEDNRIVFGFDKQSVEKLDQVTLSLLLKPKLLGSQKKINLTVVVNDQEVGQMEFIEKKSQKTEFKFPVSILKDGDNVIQLLLPGVQSGKQLGVNRNGYKLGVLIEQIQLIK